MKRILTALTALLALCVLLPCGACTGEHAASRLEPRQLSDHFDGERYFNPVHPGTPPAEASQSRSRYRWLWRWVFGDSWPEWPEAKVFSPGPPPPARVPSGTLRVTPVGHATFLVQMDGLNILIDPIWSERCSPVSWAGPRRYKQPGLRFEDLPPIDVVLVTHNHYDHLDLPTLERLARKGTPAAVTPLGNAELLGESGIPAVSELDWWQSVRLSPEVTATLVPAQHFSARTPWDRNRTLWGAFVLSGPSGNLFHAGDTGYGPHFREIGRRFSPLRMALLPISPFRPRDSPDSPASNYLTVHMGPAEAVQAHLDLGAQVSLASHYQVFQLGTDGFDDAVSELAIHLKERNLPPEAFIAPPIGRAFEAGGGVAETGPPTVGKKLSLNRVGLR